MKKNEKLVYDSKKKKLIKVRDITGGRVIIPEIKK